MFIAPHCCERWRRDWIARGGPIGYWIQVVRADGSPIGPLEFVELEPADRSAPTERAREASRKLATELGSTGLLGRVIAPGWSAADNYVNAWEKALDGGAPSPRPARDDGGSHPVGTA